MTFLGTFIMINQTNVPEIALTCTKYLGNLVNQPSANIIKLPNISASIPQIKNAIIELQKLGYNIPGYPDDPQNDDDEENKKIYDLVKGSAVNPVLREVNSDRRVPSAIKNSAKANPHSMGEWKEDSKTHISTMNKGDFRNNEKSLTLNTEKQIYISHTNLEGKEEILKDDFQVQKG